MSETPREEMTLIEAYEKCNDVMFSIGRKSDQPGCVVLHIDASRFDPERPVETVKHFGVVSVQLREQELFDRDTPESGIAMSDEAARRLYKTLHEMFGE